MGNSIVDSVVAAIEPSLAQAGFSRNTEGFFRIRPQFVDYLSIQVRSDNAAIALNAGVQPVFMLSPEKQTIDSLRGASEIDCYIRKRLAPEGQADYWLSIDLGPTRIAKEITEIFEEHGQPFFEFFASLQVLCRSLTIEEIQSKNVSKYFSMLTKSRLAHLGAMAHMTCGNQSLAKVFAEYGLSVAGMAVSLKKEFKRIIAAAEQSE